jgi:hypothetical protein
MSTASVLTTAEPLAAAENPPALPNPPLLSYQMNLASDREIERQFQGQDMIRLVHRPLRCELRVPYADPEWERVTLRDDVISNDPKSLPARGGASGWSVETADSSPWWSEPTDYRYGLAVDAKGRRSVWLLTSSEPAPATDPGADGPLPFPAGTYTLFDRRVEGPRDPLPDSITVAREGESTVVYLGEERSTWAVSQEGRVRARFADHLYVEMRKSARPQVDRRQVLYGIVLQKKEINEPTITGVWGAESGGGTGGGDE